MKQDVILYLINKEIIRFPLTSDYYYTIPTHYIIKHL